MYDAQYWDDDELMTKISAKIRAAQMEKQKEAAAASPVPAEGSDGLPVVSKTAPIPPPPTSPLATLFDAAKKGDVELATKMITEESVDVNAKVRSGDHCTFLPHSRVWKTFL